MADVLARAGAALYRAKESGRNRVELVQAAWPAHFCRIACPVSAVDALFA